MRPTSGETTTALAPATIESLYAFAYTMLQGAQISAAVHAFRVLVRGAPTDERGWLGLGACHEELDQRDVAAELFGAGALVSAPPSARCLLALARATDDADIAADALARAAALAESSGDGGAARLVGAERR